MNKSTVFYTSLLSLLLCSSLSVNAQSILPKGFDLDGLTSEDVFGNAVSMPDANTIAVGAPQYLLNSTTGYVQVLTWNGSSWIQKGSILEGDEPRSEFGRAVSMPDPNTVAIGAPEKNIAKGQVKIFRWDGTSWIQKGSSLDGRANGDRFGRAISMPDSNTVAIGAYANDQNGAFSGHAVIYKWDGSDWVKKGSDFFGQNAGDLLGSAVSMPDSNTVAIGSEGENNNTGSVRVYDWNGTSWTQIGSALSGDNAFDRLGSIDGTSISMPTSTTIAVGAKFHDGNGAEAGLVQVYTYSAGSWSQKGSDLNGEAAFDNFGLSVSMPNENTLVVGAPYNAGSGTSAGHARIFTYNGAAWTQIGSDIDAEAADDRFGVAVTMPDSVTVGIGGHFNDGNGNRAGHVRVYRIVDSPTQLILNSGNGQSAIQGTAPNTPLSVVVKDANNVPVTGVDVTFAVTTGGGIVSPAILTNLDTSYRTGGTTINSTDWKAYLFSTIGTSYTVSRISLLLNSDDASYPSETSVKVAIYSVVNGEPAVELSANNLETFTLQNDRTWRTFILNAPVSLAANTSYALVVSGTSAGQFKWSNSDNNHIPVSPVGLRYLGTLASVNSGGSWSDTFSGNRIQGNNVMLLEADSSTPLTTVSTKTNNAGVASVGSWTLGSSVGSNELTVTNSGLTGSPLTITATSISRPISLSTSTLRAGSAELPADGFATSTITIQLRDQYGNALNSGGAAVEIFTTAGTLSAVTDANNGSYTATLTADTLITTALVTATVNGAALPDTAIVAMTPPPALSLKINTQPEAEFTDSLLLTSPVIELLDRLGRRATSATDSVHVSLSDSSTGRLEGTLKVAPVEGLATFSDLALIASQDTTFRLVFTSGEMDSVVSDSITLKFYPRLITPQYPRFWQVDTELQPTFRWSEARFAQTYDLQVGYSDGFEDSTLYISQTGLTELHYQADFSFNGQSQHYYRIRAKNQNGYGPWSQTWPFITQIGAPVDARLQLPADKSKDISFTPYFKWQQAPDALTYQLQVANDAGFESIVLDSARLKTREFILPVYLRALTTYHYRVRGENTAGFGPWRSASFTTRDPERPGRVRDLVVEQLSSKGFSGSSQSGAGFLLRWTSPEFDGGADITNYQILYRAIDEQEWSTVERPASADTVAEVSGFIQGTTYAFDVLAENIAGLSEPSENPITVSNESYDEIPNQVMLQQNYPNPFNPTTTIRYGLPQAGEVRLEVYTMLGQRIAILSEGRRSQGWHSVELDASQWPSGTYLYRLQTAGTMQVRTFTLIK